MTHFCKYCTASAKVSKSPRCKRYMPRDLVLHHETWWNIVMVMCSIVLPETEPLITVRHVKLPISPVSSA